jgi:hypothetical protein
MAAEESRGTPPDDKSLVKTAASGLAGLWDALIRIFNPGPTPGAGADPGPGPGQMPGSEIDPDGASFKFTAR